MAKSKTRKQDGNHFLGCSRPTHSVFVSDFSLHKTSTLFPHIQAAEVKDEAVSHI